VSTSNSVDFSVNRDELIKDSLITLGVIAQEDTPSAAIVNHAARQLNLMLKAWQADGLHLWVIRQQSVTPVASQYNYTLGRSSADVTMDRPIRILDAFRRETATLIDTPITELGRKEYWKLSDKDSEGTPTNWYFNPQLDNSELNIWPAPDSTFASDYTIELLYSKPFDDMDTASNDFEFPQEWLLAIQYGLAVILAPSYGVRSGQLRAIAAIAEEEKQRVLGWDRENTSTYIQPDKK